MSSTRSCCRPRERGQHKFSVAFRSPATGLSLIPPANVTQPLCNPVANAVIAAQPAGSVRPIWRNVIGETRVAVNPTNLNNVILGTFGDETWSFFQLTDLVSFSFDGGLTWAPGQPADPTKPKYGGPPLPICMGGVSESAGDPQVSFFGNGVAIFVMIGSIRNDANQIRSNLEASLSFDGGRTWSNRIVLVQQTTGPLLQVDYPVLARDLTNPNAMYVSVVSFPDASLAQPVKIHYYKLTQTGTTVTTGPQQTAFIGTGLVENVTAPFLLAFPDGKLSISYRFDSASGVRSFRYARSKFAGGANSTGGPGTPADWDTFTAYGTLPTTFAANTLTCGVETIRPGTTNVSADYSPRYPLNVYMTFSLPLLANTLWNSTVIIASYDGGETWTKPKLASKPGFQAWGQALKVNSNGVVAVQYTDDRYNDPCQSAKYLVDTWASIYSPYLDVLQQDIRLSSISSDLIQQWRVNLSGTQIFGTDYWGLTSAAQDFISPHLIVNPNVAPILLPFNDGSTNPARWVNDTGAPPGEPERVRSYVEITRLHICDTFCCCEPSPRPCGCSTSTTSTTSIASTTSETVKEGKAEVEQANEEKECGWRNLSGLLQ